MHYVYTALDLHCHRDGGGRRSIMDLIARRAESGFDQREARFLNAVAATGLTVGRAYIDVKEGRLRLVGVGDATISYMKGACEPHVFYHCGEIDQRD